MPFAVFGLMYWMNATQAADTVPAYLPVKIFWVYLSGAGLIGAAVSMYIGKYDRLAAALLAVMLLSFVLLVHLPGAMGGGESGARAMHNVLKDLGLMAGAMIYAQYLAKDGAVTG